MYNHATQFLTFQALALVEEETRRYRPTKNYLEHLPPLALSSPFETPLLRAETDRVSARAPLDTLSMRRYELPTPPAGKMTDVAAWSECVDNSLAQLEHQATRIANLELMVDYGSEAWKVYNEVLTRMMAESTATLNELKRRVQDVNWTRKTQQGEVGDKLGSLESRWVGLVSKNYEIEQALTKMEAEIKRLQSEQQVQQES